MRLLFKQFRPFFLYAGFFSLFINLLLLAPALYMLQVFDRVLTSRHEETLVLLTLLTFGALVVMMFLEVLRSRLLAGAAVALDRRLGPRVLSSLLEGARQPGGTDNVHGLKDLGTLRTFLTGPAMLSLFDAPWLPIYILVIFLFHPLMGVIACVGALALFLLALLNEKLTRKPLEALQTEGRRAGRFVDQGLRNAEVVGALGMVQGVTKAWQATNRKVLELQQGSGQWSSRISAMTKFMRQLIQVSMLGAGAWLVIGLNVSPGIMVAATILLGRALAPMETLIAGWRTLVDARSAASRLQAFLVDDADAPGVTTLPAPEGGLSLDKVVFAFRGRERPILKGVSWELAAGKALAILGPSASGKSTLARLIVGVWKPISGSVRLDGADVSTWPREQLGPYIGYLPQDVELFAGTVSENIARLGQTDSESVIAAARRANAHDMILHLPNGYDTQIGEGGAVLSGGQRQRIGLARALYGAPRLMVLDEPNASLDAEGEEALISALHQLKQEQVTLIVITHRPTLVAGMDQVLVLRDGSVELFASRDEFLAKVSLLSRPSAVSKTDPRARQQVGT